MAQARAPGSPARGTAPVQRSASRSIRRAAAVADAGFAAYAAVSSAGHHAAASELMEHFNLRGGDASSAVSNTTAGFAMPSSSSPSGAVRPSMLAHHVFNEAFAAPVITSVSTPLVTETSHMLDVMREETGLMQGIAQQQTRPQKVMSPLATQRKSAATVARRRAAGDAALTTPPTTTTTSTNTSKARKSAGDASSSITRRKPLSTKTSSSKRLPNESTTATVTTTGATTTATAATLSTASCAPSGAAAAAVAAATAAATATVGRAPIVMASSITQKSSGAASSPTLTKGSFNVGITRVKTGAKGKKALKVRALNAGGREEEWGRGTSSGTNTVASISNMEESDGNKIWSSVVNITVQSGPDSVRTLRYRVDTVPVNGPFSCSSGTRRWSVISTRSSYTSSSHRTVPSVAMTW